MWENSTKVALFYFDTIEFAEITVTGDILSTNSGISTL